MAKDVEADYLQSVRQLFAERLRMVRVARGESREAVAKRCGLSLSHYKRLELASANPPLKTIAQVAWALEVNPAVFFAPAANSASDDQKGS